MKTIVNTSAQIHMSINVILNKCTFNNSNITFIIKKRLSCYNTINFI